MAKWLSAGQRTAIRAAITRRGELGLTQKQLAQVSGVGEATIQNMEAYRSWPRPDTLAKLERLGLGWPVGYLSDLAAKEDEQAGPRPESREEAVHRLQHEVERLSGEINQLMDRIEQEAEHEHDRRRRAG